MQWLERTIRVAELGVVVVLDDRCVVPVGEGQQRTPPSEAHGHPAGRLVRRGRVDDLHVLRDPIDDDALTVHRHRHDAQPDRLEQQPHGRIAGILHGDRVAGPQHRAHHEVNGLLRTRRHEDLVGVDDHPSRPADPPRQHLPQRLEPGGLAVARERSVQRRRRTPSPLGGREERGVGLPAAQVDASGWWCCRGRRCGLDLDGTQHRATVGCPPTRRGPVHRRATAGAPRQVSLGDEQAVRRRDRVSRHAEFGGQFS